MHHPDATPHHRRGLSTKLAIAVVSGATAGSASPTTVAPVNAAIASVFDRPLRCSVIASG